MKKRTFELFDRPIAFHRCFVRITHSVDAALMLSQALYWSDRTSDDTGWFYKSQKQWEEETGLSRSEQEIARKALKATGFWQERLGGVPATLYFRVDCRILQTRLQDYSILVCENLQTRLRDSANITSSETTTETTSENTHAEMVRVFSTPEFERFWEIYPNKIDKAGANREWFHVPFADKNVEAILGGLVVWKASERWQEERFIPSPDKFLKRRQWEAKPPSKPAKGPDLQKQLEELERKNGLRR